MATDIVFTSHDLLYEILNHLAIPTPSDDTVFYVEGHSEVTAVAEDNRRALLSLALTSTVLEDIAGCILWRKLNQRGLAHFTHMVSNSYTNTYGVKKMTPKRQAELVARVHCIVYGPTFRDLTDDDVLSTLLPRYGTTGMFCNLDTVVWFSAGEELDRVWLRVLIEPTSRIHALIYSATYRGFLYPTPPIVEENDIHVFIELYHSELRHLTYDVDCCEDSVVYKLPHLHNLRQLVMEDMHPEIFNNLRSLSQLQVLKLNHIGTTCEVPYTGDIILPSLQALTITSFSCAELLPLFNSLSCPILKTFSFKTGFALLSTLKDAEQVLSDLCERRFFREKQNTVFDLRIHLDFSHCCINTDIEDDDVTFTPFPPPLLGLPIEELSVYMRSTSRLAEVSLEALTAAWPHLSSFRFDQSGRLTSETRAQWLPFQPSIASMFAFILAHKDLRVFKLDLENEIVEEDIADAESTCLSQSDFRTHTNLEYFHFGIVNGSSMSEQEVIIEDPVRLARLIRRVFPNIRDVCYPSPWPFVTSFAYDRFLNHLMYG